MKTKARRKTIAADPLDALVPAGKKTPPRRRAEDPVEAKVAKLPPRLRATFQLRQDLLDRLRNVAYWLSGPPARLSLTRIVEEGVLRELERLEKVHHKGKPFPQREDELRGGRPVGS